MTHFDDVFVFSCLVVSHSLRPQALQHARLPTVLHHLQSLLTLIPLMMYATAQLLCERNSPFLGRRALGTWGKGQSSAHSGRRRACLQVNAPACDTRASVLVEGAASLPPLEESLWVGRTSAWPDGTLGLVLLARISE